MGNLQKSWPLRWLDNQWTVPICYQASEGNYILLLLLLILWNDSVSCYELHALRNKNQVYLSSSFPTRVMGWHVLSASSRIHTHLCENSQYAFPISCNHSHSKGGGGSLCEEGSLIWTTAAEATSLTLVQTKYPNSVHQTIFHYSCSPSMKMVRMRFCEQYSNLSAIQWPLDIRKEENKIHPFVPVSEFLIDASKMQSDHGRAKQSCSCLMSAQDAHGITGD